MATLTADRNFQWSILSPASGETLTDDLTLQWAILSSDPLPVTGLTADFTFRWRIFGTDTLSLVLNGAPPGLVGILTIELETADDSTTIYGPTDQQIVESPPLSGRYVATVPNPGVGVYFIIWSDGVSQTIEDLEILPGGIGIGVFLDRTPPARSDAIPWTSVQVMEGAARQGPYVAVESFPLVPLDDDPAAPAGRDITTTQATLTSGWYALAWTDDAGHQTMTNPEYHTNVINIT